MYAVNPHRIIRAVCLYSVQTQLSDSLHLPFLLTTLLTSRSLSCKPFHYPPFAFFSSMVIAMNGPSFPL